MEGETIYMTSAPFWSWTFLQILTFMVKLIIRFLCGKRISLKAYMDDFTNQARCRGKALFHIRASPQKELHFCAKMLKKSTSLLQAIESRIMDRFWCSSCLNNSINLPDMIGSLASGANTSLMAKNGTKKISHLFEELQASNFEGFWRSRCLNDCIDLATW